MVRLCVGLPLPKNSRSVTQVACSLTRPTLRFDFRFPSFPSSLIYLFYLFIVVVFQDVDHDVEVVGYGTDENGTPYWNIRNSWGTYWGENGFFKLARGINNLRVEEGAGQRGWCWR